MEWKTDHGFGGGMTKRILQVWNESALVDPAGESSKVAVEVFWPGQELAEYRPLEVAEQDPGHSAEPIGHQVPLQKQSIGHSLYFFSYCHLNLGWNGAFTQDSHFQMKT